MSHIKVIPVRYTGANKFGDFSYMIKKCRQFDDGLFIFNDNVENQKTASRGSGNAVIRPYNQYGKHREYPRSAGIPTGSLKSGGFSELDTKTKRAIDNAINEIRNLIKTHGYRRVFYSAKADGSIGSKIFNINPQVVEYVTQSIRDLSHVPVTPLTIEHKSDEAENLFNCSQFLNFCLFN